MKMNGKLNKEFFEDFKLARKAYIYAKALNELVLQIDNESKQEVLNEHIFLYGDEGVDECERGTRITKHNQDYNMSNEDFIKFLKLVHKKRVEKGLVLPYTKYSWAVDKPWNLSADCETRETLKAAENLFIDVSLKLLPKTLSEKLEGVKTPYIMKIRNKFIETNLRLKLE